MANPAIYHITHVDNLAGIVAAGRLWSDVKCAANAVPHTNIGYRHIKERRMRRNVTVAARGVLGDYVPFNFCPRSVMLYVVSQGHRDYNDGQRRVVHLVSSVDAMVATGRPWFFTDRHAELGYAAQYDSLASLPAVDWAVMPLQYWAGSDDVRERRQAEFLVHDWCPWQAIQAVGVYDEAVADEVRAAIAATDHQPTVEVRRDWYY